jgi:glycosyl transferase family 25
MVGLQANVLLKMIPDAGCHLNLSSGGRPAILSPIVVNLSSRIDRWKSVQKNLSEVNIINPVRFNAQDGRYVLNETVNRLVSSDSAYPAVVPKSHLDLTRPALGCFISHLQIWKQFLTSSAERVVVLEDDALASAWLLGHEDSIIQSEFNAIPDDADLVLLGCNIIADLVSETEHRRFQRVYYFNGTYAYAITRRGCEKLLQHLVPARTHIDHQISRALVECSEEIRAYVMNPMWFDHDYSSQSDASVPMDDMDFADQHFQMVIDKTRAKLRSKGISLGKALQ